MPTSNAQQDQVVIYASYIIRAYMHTCIIHAYIKWSYSNITKRMVKHVSADRFRDARPRLISSAIKVIKWSRIQSSSATTASGQAQQRNTANNQASREAARQRRRSQARNEEDRQQRVVTVKHVVMQRGNTARGQIQSQVAREQQVIKHDTRNKTRFVHEVKQ